jgi:type IV pilus assembly protein PilB
MTGHLVLSTLHTNDAPSTISRLMNMGIEPFLVATSVHMIVAQRLIRRVCTFCKEPLEVANAGLVSAGFSEQEARTLKLFKGRGCERCSNTGYKGRLGLYEVLEVDDEMKEMVLSGASSFELRLKAIQAGMMTLRMSGLQKVRDGITTVEEVVRETVL